MSTIFDLIEGLKQEDWDYYYQLDGNSKLNNPFDNCNYRGFINDYIDRSGKRDFFHSVVDRFTDEIRPSHICSVFFLGILICRNTDILKDLQISPKNDSKYDTFTFLWFLITLFHDIAFDLERHSDRFSEIKSLMELMEKFEINKSILDNKRNKKLSAILELREKYFLYRLIPENECQELKLDHGIIAGLLLYDRLTKIRKLKKANNEGNQFWGKYLIIQYALAAEAITLHNIWLPQNDADEKKYLKRGLQNLVNFKPIKFTDFPLFYILGIIDTIDPIKTFKTDQISEKEIFNSLCLEFGKKKFSIINKETSKLEFWKITKKAVNLYGWLDVSISFTDNKLTIKFK